MQTAIPWTSANRRSTFPLIPNGDGPGEDVIQFLPRFLLQEIIFAQCPYENLFLNQPRLGGNLLCRADWFCLRGTASCECAILPIRVIATYFRCSACEQTSSGERPAARWSLPAPAPVNKLFWQPAENHQDHHQPEMRNGELDADAVPFLPRFLLWELIFAQCPHQSRPPIRGNILHKSDCVSLRGIEGTERDILPIWITANY